MSARDRSGEDRGLLTDPHGPQLCAWVDRLGLGFSGSLEGSGDCSVNWWRTIPSRTVRGSEGLIISARAGLRPSSGGYFVS